MKKALILFLFASLLKAGYNTSLEIKQDLPDLSVLISPDGQTWNYLEEGRGLDSDCVYSSLDIPGDAKSYSVSVGKKTPFKRSRALFNNIVPLSEPLAVSLRSRATNFLYLYLSRQTAASTFMSDGLQIKKLTFALLSDADGDGLPDDREYPLYGAWPGLRDTDGDGWHDGEEARLCSSAFLADSDGDGLPDSSDPHPLLPEFELSYEAWSSHWAQVVSRKPSLYFPGALGKARYAAKASPLRGTGAGEALFSPATITLSENSCLTNEFSLTFFSEGAVTGAFLFSEEMELIPDSVQLVPEYMLPALPDDLAALPFLCRHGLPLRFRLILPEIPEEQEEILLLTKEGLRSEKLLLTRNGPPERKPLLLSPEDGSEINSGVTLQWEYDGGSATNYLLTVSGEEYFELSLPGTSYYYLPSASGRYHWSVTAQGEDFSRESESRSFFYSGPEGNSDSDGDGYSDWEEKRRDSDPADPKDIPLQAPSNVWLRARLDLFFSYFQQVMGGLRPLSFRAASALPPGLKLSRDGRLSGLPLRTGRFPLKTEISDSAGKSLVMELDLEVEGSATNVLKLGSSGG